MIHNFQVRSLEDVAFNHLFTLDDAALAKLGAIRMRVDKQPGFPCRVSLEDASIGEEVMLLTYEHHTTNSPYRAAGPVFIRKIARTASLKMNELPLMLEHRQLSIRGYDADGMMKEAMLSEGKLLRNALDKVFENDSVRYIHIHNAKPGCYNCVADRVY